MPDDEYGLRLRGWHSQSQSNGTCEVRSHGMRSVVHCRRRGRIGAGHRWKKLRRRRMQAQTAPARIRAPARQLGLCALRRGARKPESLHLRTYACTQANARAPCGGICASLPSWLPCVCIPVAAWPDAPTHSTGSWTVLPGRPTLSPQRSTWLPCLPANPSRPRRSAPGSPPKVSPRQSPLVTRPPPRRNQATIKRGQRTGRPP
jgi:hypothetical protein